MSQSLSQVWVHIIFSTKNRHPFLKDPNVRERTYHYMGAICTHLQCKVVAINGVEDHVHLLVGLHKNISLSELVEKIKKSSSKWIKTLSAQHNDLNKFYWQSGYGAFSVSQSNLEIMQSYALSALIILYPILPRVTVRYAHLDPGLKTLRPTGLYRLFRSSRLLGKSQFRKRLGGG